MTDSKQLETRKETPVDRMKKAMTAESVQQQFRNALQESSALFTASLIDLYGADNQLQKCEPRNVIMEALKAATLKLPINKNLGFAWVIARAKNTKNPDGSWSKTFLPGFQMGWKGWVQLAMRTGQYRYINADMVYEGEEVQKDRITGELRITGAATSENVIGYFAFFETLNGFKKGIYWTRDKAHAHGKKYSPSYANKDSAWQTSPDAMCLKTVVTNLLSKWGILSVEMQQAMASDVEEQHDPQQEAEENENSEVIDVKATPVETKPVNGTVQAEQEPGY